MFPNGNNFPAKKPYMKATARSTSSLRPHNGRALLGQRVRETRRRLGRTLQDISAATGLAKSTLSKIENGVLSINYDNLIKLAQALSVDVATLFAEGGGPSATAGGRRSVAREGQGKIYQTAQYRYEMLCGDLSPKKIFPIVATLKAHTVAGPESLIRHPGEEFAFVLEGMVEVHCEFYSPLTLRPGDGIYLDSTMGHVLISSGKEDARILWIGTSEITPPQAPRTQPAEPPKKAVKRRKRTR
jgi:transcriptional regulator with XRE-family HTH domain